MLLACDAGTSSKHADGAAPTQLDATIAHDSPSEGSEAVDAPEALDVFEAAAVPEAAPPDGGGAYPPPMACDTDASAEASITMCPPPISVCNGPTPSAEGDGIYYYDWGQCMSGWCTWTQHLMPCPYHGSCANGACATPPTM